MLSSQGSRFLAAAAAVNDAANDAVDHMFSEGCLDDLVDAKDGGFYVSTMELKNTLLRGKAALQTLKKLTAVLNALLELSEENVTAIQTKLHPLVLQDGIDSLPDDVLSLVFEYFCADCVDDEDARMNLPVTLSLLSRRFRNLALHLPRIWANINLGLVKSHGQLDTWLSRSKSSVLDLEISGEVPEAFLQKVSNVAVLSRLQTLTFNTETTSYGLTTKLVRNLLDHFDGLSFPDLDHLNIRFGGYFTESEEGQPMFRPTWDMPNLRSLTAYNIIPKLFLPSLTHCELSIVSYDAGPAIGSPFQLLSFFRSTPNLTHLTLRFEFVLFREIDSEETTLVGVTKLSNLESLSLKIFDEVEAEGCRNLLNDIDFPVLSRLTAAFYLGEEQPLGDWIEYVLFHVNDISNAKPRYPMLEDLTLLFRAMRNGSGPYFFGCSLDCISNLTPTLKHLTIDAPCISCPLNTYPPVPNLRTLTLRRIFDLYDGYIANLIGQERSGGPLRDTFEKLEVAGCPELDLEELEKVLPKAKICWRDRAPKYEDDYYYFTGW
ncbi:hypothetical protein DFH11DRAFT_1611188 [Phellopilus nigrolimitatus]|nr:hypothetical protein DFH11DRAFT_1611188 [Phellopilus nigrolimitatus]